MNQAINRIVLKANRSLGSCLNEIGLVGIDQLDEANEIFVTRLKEGTLAEASLLRILLFDIQAFTENELVSQQIENDSVGATTMESYNIQEEVTATVSLEECMATWTVPIDHWHGTTFLASAYQKSEFVRQFWSERIDGPVSWLVCPFGSLESYFEQRLKDAAEEEDVISVKEA